MFSYSCKLLTISATVIAAEYIPRIAGTKQTTRVATKATAMEKEAKRKSVMNAAFDSIFDLYKDEKELSRTLASAKKKISELQSEQREVKHKVQTLDHHIDKAQYEINMLKTRIYDGENSTSPNRQNANSNPVIADTLADIAASVLDHARSSERYVSLKERLEKVKAEVEEAKRYVKMLEGAISVANVGGMKRAREESPNSQVGGTQRKVKLHPVQYEVNALCIEAPEDTVTLDSLAQE